tara:strand:+ start:257 stop:478 length:222 start_codon:yes stop_codon:yes gene_type:complete
MELKETTIRQTEGGYEVEMTLCDGDPETDSCVRLRVHVEAHPEGRLPLQGLQATALRRAQDAITELRQNLEQI